MFKTPSNGSDSTRLLKNNSPKILPEDKQTKVCYDSRLADRFGVNEAILLSRMIWSIEKHKDANDTEFFHDGAWWMYDTIPAFMKYSGLGRKQILNAQANLTKEGIIEKGQFDRKFAQRRNWFSVNLDALYIATQMSCPIEPIVPKRNHLSSRKGTIDSAERGLSIVPKGDDTSLYTKIPSESLSNTHSNFSPQSPQGEIGIGSLSDELKSKDRKEGKDERTKVDMSQNRKIIPPVVLYTRTIETHPHFAKLGCFALTDFQECTFQECFCGKKAPCANYWALTPMGGRS